MKRILMSTMEALAPDDLEDGDLVEAIQLGGPTDGDTIGYFRVRWLDDELDLQPVDASVAMMTAQLPDAMTVEIGSPAQEDLRFALLVLSLHTEDRLDDLDACWNSDLDEAIERAIDTLRALTRDVI